ncbi:MAG: hypothetical protein ACTSSR_02915 [Alphaproteobacteria bacterium]
MQRKLVEALERQVHKNADALIQHTMCVSESVAPLGWLPALNPLNLPQPSELMMGPQQPLNGSHDRVSPTD